MFVPSSSSAALLLAGAIAGGASALTVPSTPPKNASGQVDPSFLGFGIECASFPQYTESNFSLNMFSAFTKRLGGKAPLLLRLGGTSTDNSVWKPDQQEAVNFPNGDNGLTSLLYIGKDWLSGFSKIPGAKFEVQLPLARENMTNGVEFLKAEIKAMGGLSNLYAIAFGNEPNFYPGSDRPKSYNLTDYVGQFTAYESAVDKARLSLPQQIYRALDYSSGVNFAQWSAPAAFDQGINTNGKLKEISMHFYSAGGGASLPATNLNQTYVQASVDRFSAQIAAAKARKLPFILGEVGDVINQPNNPGFSAGLASAVWTANWMLYCMTQGVARVQMQLLHGAAFDSWHPAPTNNSLPIIAGTFYGEVMIADILAAADKGLRVAQIDSGIKNFPAYAAYNGGALSRVMLFNNELWAGSGQRPSQNVSLTLPADTKKVTVYRLSGPNGRATADLQWAGQRWTYPSGQPSNGNNDTEVLNVASNGVVSVVVPATEGAMVVLA